MIRKAVALLLALSLILPTALPAADTDSVKVMLQDGSVVQGELIGIDNGTITLRTKAGKIREYGPGQIRKAFDGDGHKLDLSEGSAADESPRSKPAKPAEKPAAPRESGGGKAGRIMTGVGLGVFLIGGLIGVLGMGTMNDATSTYYTGPNNSAGAVYTIPGQQGYYTYSQYTQYYSGQTVAYTGLGIGVIGLGVSIAGLIVGSSARRNTALLEVDGSQWALGLPQTGPLPGGAYGGRLLEAHF